jgi:hypothetical protein
MEKPILHSAKFEFSQEGNCNGSTNEVEELTIELESSTVIEDGECYIVLRTPTGWSIDSLDELAELIERCKKVI